MPEPIDLLKMDDDALNRLYMRTFNTPDGQLVLKDLEFRCNVILPSYPEFGEIDIHRVMANEGRRSIVIMIKTRINPEGSQPKGE